MQSLSYYDIIISVKRKEDKQNMIDIYEFIEQCKEEGMTSQQAMLSLGRYMNECRNSMIEDYYNDPIVHDGWHQQDIIDMYRIER